MVGTRRRMVYIERSTSPGANSRSKSPPLSSTPLARCVLRVVFQRDSLVSFPDHTHLIVSDAGRNVSATCAASQPVGSSPLNDFMHYMLPLPKTPGQWWANVPRQGLEDPSSFMAMISQRSCH